MASMKRLGDILGTVSCKLELMFRVDGKEVLKLLKDSKSIKFNLLKYVWEYIVLCSY